jgi:phage terminase large subunit
VDDENFDNLKSQCYFKLADAINIGMVKIDCDAGHKDLIIQELENVKQKSVDKDQKKGVIPKDMVKQLIGRSPDFSDAISMRFVFEIGVKRGVLRVKGF